MILEYSVYSVSFTATTVRRLMRDLGVIYMILEYSVYSVSLRVVCGATHMYTLRNEKVSPCLPLRPDT